MEIIEKFIGWAALGMELLAVLIIVVASIFGSARFLIHLNKRVIDGYKQFKCNLGKALLLGLEFLIAADIIRTVTLEQSLQNVGVLALLVVVRTFLSWSVTIEIEERLPWVKSKN